MSEEEKEKIGSAKASPTKAFFVRMLTRDIELQDAILDLLDNCLDGILRTGKKTEDTAKPYQGYFAKLTFSNDCFEITDNCGGIPFDTAQKYAFAMGRPDDADDLTPETIGMYGIGMKRAIFKMGLEAIVESKADSDFDVEISSKWMTSDEWTDLPIYKRDEQDGTERGTTIIVSELNEEASKAFSDADWIEEFKRVVSQHYSIIIAKGFQVFIGTPEEIAADPAPIAAQPFKLLVAKDRAEDQFIAPYVFQGSIGDVSVEIYAGLYRELLTPEELDAEEETRGRKDDAGWTVACNDRVVIWKDKTKLTGWGEASVPNYHGQFIAITGLVLLRAADPKKLPLTTTKRGIDGSSDVYLTAKDLMREATKAFTGFTNKWKKFPEKREVLYKNSEYAGLPDLQALVTDLPMSGMRKLEAMNRFAPKLPVPIDIKTTTRISYLVEKADVAKLSEFLFEDTNVSNEELGKATFNRALDEIPEAAE